jgi:hypothetical protein
LSVLAKIRFAAKECGYAIGVHGSLRRDLDLIAVPWIEKPADKNELAVKIHQAACGIQRQTYEWEKKPQGRTATAFPICWTEWNEPSLGHIDLSVMEVMPSEQGVSHGESKEPECLKCHKVMNSYACADACAVADLRQCRAIVTCSACGAKNQIYSVSSYRVLKLFEPDPKKAT